MSLDIETDVVGDKAALRWWREARFGMFIHWGLYAQLAGMWKGQAVPGIGEWIMSFGRIPPDEYAQIAARFNPTAFDAEQWVQLAHRAGMKYLVITAKHHDGFAMYHSPNSPYNIVTATPFARDPMSELAEACHKHGIRLCFYYSQTQDWHHPGGAGHWQRSVGRKPAMPDGEPFQVYLDQKVKPQLNELLTQYGPVGLIWFDTPLGITPQQSSELRQWVKALQPDCLVCGRIGNHVGDYNCLGDNMIPVARPKGNWETPATINDTWGYKRDDENWKSVDRLLYLLVDLASKGVNYLLNVGPTAEGTIPEPSVERLKAMGDWLAVNGEAIYGTQASPYPYEFLWGRMTQKRRQLYLHMLRWPKGPLRIRGLRSPVQSARLLAAPHAPVAFRQEHDERNDEHLLELNLPGTAPSGRVPVVRLDFDGPIDVDETPMQQSDATITLPAMHGHVTPPGAIHFARNGRTEGWTTLAPSLQWRFKITQPGRFHVELLTGRRQREDYPHGQTVALKVDDQVLSGELRHDRDEDSPRAQYQPEAVSRLGTLDIPQAGEHIATLRATHIAEQTRGLMLSCVRLCPA